MFRNSNFLIVILFGFLFISCNQKNKGKSEKESILKGTMDIAVDETLVPIVEDQVAVFEGTYDAKIIIKPKSEAEVINDLLNQKVAVAFTARDLTEEEKNVFNTKKIVPRVTPVAEDAIAFISNKDNKDTLIALKNVINFMQAKPESKIKRLIFDNPNSSTVRYLKNLADVKDIPKEGAFSFKTNEEVVKFVSENKGMIGVVGVNWLSQPSPELKPFLAKINVLGVKGLTGDKFVAPTQNNIAEKAYPLTRKLYIINCQGYPGLGMGFASFAGGDIGQRIILKSGLLPIRVPGRKLNIRNELIKEKE